MAIQMELYELKNLCMEMASLGAANYVKQTIPAKDLISQREAYRLFQECRVKRWQKDGRVSTIRGGSSIHSKVLYSLIILLIAVGIPALLISKKSYKYCKHNCTMLHLVNLLYCKME